MAQPYIVFSLIGSRNMFDMSLIFNGIPCSVEKIIYLHYLNFICEEILFCDIAACSVEKIMFCVILTRSVEKTICSV